MTKWVVFVLLLAVSEVPAQAQGWGFASPSDFELNSNNVVVAWSSHISSPRAGDTVVTVVSARITPNTTDSTGLSATIYRYVAPNILLRTALDLATERATVARAANVQALYAAKDQLTVITALRATYPNSAKLQVDQIAAIANLQSIAQSIGLTTATTQ